jgi:hypothetical protein
MNDFKSTLVACELFKLGANGPKYMWNNGKEDQDFIQEKLDRATATSDWCSYSHQHMFKSMRHLVLITIQFASD